MMLEFEYWITWQGIHVKDSYKINHSHIKEALCKIKEEESDLWEEYMSDRTMFSMKTEWATHNVLYKFGLFKSHTKDVDINTKLKWYVRTAYGLFGTLFWFLA